MKIELPFPGDCKQRLLFSNISSKNENEFYLLMTYHKSHKGGFDYPVTIGDCKTALTKKGYVYKEIKYPTGNKTK